MRWLVAVLVVLAVPAPAAACGPSRADPRQPTAGNTPPPPAPSYFAADFPAIGDSRLGTAIGGVGGLARHAPRTHTPVVFVHGNQADAQNWLAVMLQFQRLAGYTLQEMYALSYNGLGNQSAGAPTQPETAADQAYFSQNPGAQGNGGHGAANDDEVPDLCRFVAAVLDYTGAAQVDVVAHSLGVTIARRAMADDPELARHVRAFVAIAGANHGTTVCRGLDASYYGCNEIAPGTRWLADLNARGETYGPTAWMTIYDGAEGDPFFAGPDEGSPALAGADNRTFAGEYHNDLRVNVPEVDTYLAFLLGRDGDPRAAAIAAGRPDGRTGTLCGVPRLVPQDGCPPVALARLRVAVRGTLRRGACRRVGVSVGDGIGPVAGAAVRLGARVVHTRADGAVRPRVCVGRRTRALHVRATHAGYEPGRRTVRARR